jgi:hypothetical protein
LWRTSVSSEYEISEWSEVFLLTLWDQLIAKNVSDIRCANGLKAWTNPTVDMHESQGSHGQGRYVFLAGNTTCRPGKPAASPKRLNH